MSDLFRRPGRVGWADDWTSALVPLGPDDEAASAVVGARQLRPGVWFGEPPAPPGRECALCPTRLSRWNTGPMCGPCEHANRTVYPPIEVEPESVVYYAEKTGLIKIGTSTRVFDRMRALGASLLAVEPGGFAEEAERHKQFRDHNVRGEWFRPDRPLLDHIARLCGERVDLETAA